MTNFKKLKDADSIFFKDLILTEGSNFKEFLKLGWSQKQIKNHLNKDINLSYGVFDSNTLIAFILGDLINIEKSLEYEILLIYVCKNFRNQGIGNKLLNKINEKKNNSSLKKIYLEVSKTNIKAISFYNKMKFEKIYTRKKYYSSEKDKVDALVFIKYF